MNISSRNMLEKLNIRKHSHLLKSMTSNVDW